MTNLRLGRDYVAEASARVDLVRFAHGRGLHATTVREAQECVELFLKGALRLVAVEPAHTHDVAPVLRRERSRFPPAFAAQIDHLASISTALAGSRGLAYYGDERLGRGPRSLFDADAADRALSAVEFVAGLCGALAAAAGEE